MPNKRKNNTGQKKLYFGYGSNMWKEQMHDRCPNSKFVGVGILPGWKWIININGFATIVPSPEDHVYGLFYEISPSDEEVLDSHESSYTKRMIDVDIVKVSREFPRRQKDPNGGYSALSLVYVDVRTTEGPARAEYVVRMNHAIKDALTEGVPFGYIQQYLRPFIPDRPLAN